MGWQPIATAPRDGKFIGIKDGLAFTSFWQRFHTYTRDGKFSHTVFRLEIVREEGDAISSWHPTHWQSVPDLTAEDAG